MAGRLTRPATVGVASIAAIVLVGALAIPTCPILGLTGLPCPGCGGTRALFYLVQGDPAFLHYNPVWAFAVPAVAVLAVAEALPAFRGHSPTKMRTAVTSRLRAHPLVAVACGLVLGAAAWVTALVNLEWIRLA